MGRFAVVLLVYAVAVLAQSIVEQPAAGTGKGSANLTLTSHRKYNTTGFLAVITNPINHFGVSCHGCTNSPPTCGGREKTDEQAAALPNCLYAVNGGPFNMATGACMGHVVSGGSLVRNDDTTNVDFGLDKDGTFVMGTLPRSFVERRGFQSLITGFGWLVRDGKALPSPGGEIAPRTAIGTDKGGNLLIFQADGVEKTFQGLTLKQLADWFVALGVHNAVNLDGGGSSVTWYDGKVVDHPTCDDTGRKCVRAVTTIVYVTK